MANFDLMQIFNPNRQQPAAPAPAPADPATPTPQELQQQAANGVPNAFSGTAADDPSKMKSPMDEFADLFKIDENAANPEEDFTKPIFSYDAEKMGSAADGINFAQGLDPEVASKALSGDAESLQKMLNTVGKNAFMQAAKLNTSLVEKGVNQRFEQFNKILPGKIRDASVSEQLGGEEMFNHPAVKPVVDALRGQFSKAYPQASSSQLSEMVKKYFASAGEMTTSKQRQQQQSQQPIEDSFADFFGS